MSKKNKIAVIGGGIFGVSAARELASLGEVTLFERHEDICSEATRTNQNRHHYGYHYHQSDETAKQCIEAKKDFESVWGEAIISGFPNYYAVGSGALKVTPEAFRTFCERHELSYEEVSPGSHILNSKDVLACFKTDEPIYDHRRLVSMAKKELEAKGVKLRLGHEVIQGEMCDKEKVFTIKHSDQTYTENFDYAVNAMYANYNLFSNWFGLPHKSFAINLKELLLIRVKGIPRFGLTIMDRFMSLLPTEESEFFTLGDVVRSCHLKKETTGSIPWTWDEINKLPSHQADIIESNIHFAPFLADAKFIESRWILIPMHPRPENPDNRLTEVIPHGKGCWSVLGGKIVSSVTAAKEIRNAIKDEL